MKNLDLENLTNLVEYQQYIKEVLTKRGFIGQDVNTRFGLLVEEVGELAKALRKYNGEKIDINSEKNNLSDELADVLFVLLSIANNLNIDMRAAFICKEEKNNNRTWV